MVGLGVEGSLGNISMAGRRDSIEGSARTILAGQLMLER